MQNIMTFIVGAFAVVATIMLMCWFLLMLKKAMMQKSEQQNNTEIQEEPSQSETMPYMAAKLLTRREYSFFKTLQPIAQKHNLLICPKVRLADLVEIPKGNPNYTRWFNYVKAKHVDFVICDLNMNVKIIIEVDDSSHDKPDRQNRDDFVDRIFRSVNIKLLHIRQWGADLEQTICAAIGMQTS